MCWMLQLQCWALKRRRYLQPRLSPSADDLVSVATYRVVYSWCFSNRFTFRPGKPVVLDEQFNSFNFWRTDHGLILDDPDPPTGNVAAAKK